MNGHRRGNREDPRVSCTAFSLGVDKGRAYAGDGRTCLARPNSQVRKGILEKNICHCGANEKGKMMIDNHQKLESTLLQALTITCTHTNIPHWGDQLLL